MSNCNYVENLKSATRDYFNAVSKINADRQKAPENFTGEALKNEMTRLNDAHSAAWIAARDKMQSARDEKIRKYEAAKQDQLSGSALPDDIKLLSLPVPLTPEELQTLADRHPDSYIMQRAIKNYGQEHGFPVNTVPTPDEKIQDADSLYSHFNHYISSGTSGASAAEQSKENQHYFALEDGDEGVFAEFDKTLGD